MTSYGTIQREYAVGSGRMDLLVRHGPDPMAMELKIWRDGERDPLGDGITQLDRYLAGLGLDTGWLVIFDRRCDRSSPRSAPHCRAHHRGARHYRRRP